MFTNKSNEKILFGNVIVFLDSPFYNPVFNLDIVINDIEEIIPSFLFYDIDEIRIGDYKEFNERNISAFYEHGAIFLSSTIETEKEMFIDIIHELAHSLESRYGSIIYYDRELENEFRAKRNKLIELLQQAGFNPNVLLFENLEYSIELDKYLYEEVGYKKLKQIIPGLFINSYSITSLSEYWATSFEFYFSYPQQVNILKDVCPKVYMKLQKLFMENKEEYHAG